MSNKTWKDILVLDGNCGANVSTKILKEAMLQAGFNEACYDCLATHWNNKKIKFRIYHIDRYVLNNKKSNLCFLCPNCHSQKPKEHRRESRKGKSMADIAMIDLRFSEDQRCLVAFDEAAKDVSIP